MEEQEDHHAQPAGRYLSKRRRRNKGLVARFDEAARRDFVTGFQKRKKKRRKIAEQQQKKREREKRLQQRKERRLALKYAQHDTMVTPAGDLVEEFEEKIEEDLQDHEQCQPESMNGTMIYEDDNTMTIVNTIAIDPNTNLDGYLHAKDTAITRFKDKNFLKVFVRGEGKGSGKRGKTRLRGSS